MVHPNQVKDEPQLLEKMMHDMHRAEPLYKPTNYWELYQQFFLPELKTKGLKDFRSREKSVLGSFGATDLKLKAQLKYTGKKHVPEFAKGIKILNTILDKFQVAISYNFPIEEIATYFFEIVQEKFKKYSLDIFKCSTSEYGAPEDITMIRDTAWSRDHLQYCSMFIDTYPYIQFQQDMIVCEIGPGLGRNIEILAKLFPQATFLVFDIPPQLYVANQYLSAVFPDRVISYEKAITIDPATIKDLLSKIIILPTWKLPEWARTKIDIFWNSASFQEMEPDVVQNYLSLIKTMSPEHIYINAMPGGNYYGEWKPGQGGTKLPVVENYYIDTLKDSYSLIKKQSTDYFLRKHTYMSYIFKHKGRI